MSHYRHLNGGKSNKSTLKTKKKEREHFINRTHFYDKREEGICYYYLQGYCNKGDNCSFLHELPEGIQTRSQKLKKNTIPVSKRLGRALSNAPSDVIPEIELQHSHSDHNEYDELPPMAPLKRQDGKHGGGSNRRQRTPSLSLGRQRAIVNNERNEKEWERLQKLSNNDKKNKDNNTKDDDDDDGGGDGELIISESIQQQQQQQQELLRPSRSTMRLSMEGSYEAFFENMPDEHKVDLSRDASNNPSNRNSLDAKVWAFRDACDSDDEFTIGKTNNRLSFDQRHMQWLTNLAFQPRSCLTDRELHSTKSESDSDTDISSSSSSSWTIIKKKESRMQPDLGFEPLEGIIEVSKKKKIRKNLWEIAAGKMNVSNNNKELKRREHDRYVSSVSSLFVNMNPFEYSNNQCNYSSLYNTYQSFYIRNVAWNKLITTTDPSINAYSASLHCSITLLDNPYNANHVHLLVLGGLSDNQHAHMLIGMNLLNEQQNSNQYNNQYNNSYITNQQLSFNLPFVDKYSRPHGCSHHTLTLDHSYYNQQQNNPQNNNISSAALFLFGGWIRPLTNKDELALSLKISNEMYILPINQDKWLSLEINGSKPSPRAGHSTIIAPNIVNLNGDNRNQLVIFGGRVHGSWSSSDPCSGYDLETHLNWFGYPPGACVNDVARFDISRSKWRRSAITNPPAPRAYHSSVLYKNTNMIIFGGMDCEGRTLNDIWLLDLVNMEWKRLHSGTISGCPSGLALNTNAFFHKDSRAIHSSSPSPPPRVGALVNIVPNYLIVIGGCDPHPVSPTERQITLFRDIWCFDLTRMLWQEIIPPTPPPWFVATAHTLGSYGSIGNNRYEFVFIVHGGLKPQEEVDELWGDVTMSNDTYTFTVVLEGQQ